ncbi:hypothetical protein K435DRAFT_859854 [Dendrothele bispora CBS 962.96]|uniref:Uncharacterized protein n=1 Tax=Dendrothele bispora (strain CBS 962.96) TaxID=1314807 RepID=A0A4S8LZF7_DENBC|nr:hypothetical protein K435DRAFT_859854 [Dendrothele bispora CBS 962.96]
MLQDDDCLYYFVNHTVRTQFWLEEVQTDELGIPDYDSPSHLRSNAISLLLSVHPLTTRIELYLEELYWSHVEHFCMHLYGGLPVKLINEVICVFSHAMSGASEFDYGFRAPLISISSPDQITSRTSTFFYGQKDCKKFLKLLTLAWQHPTDGHQICVVAPKQSGMLLYFDRFTIARIIIPVVFMPLIHAPALTPLAPAPGPSAPPAPAPAPPAPGTYTTCTCTCTITILPAPAPISPAPIPVPIPPVLYLYLYLHCTSCTRWSTKVN